MNELMSYQSRKEEIRRKLRETAENFVYIGFQLKQVRESREYEQDGYSDILEFAQKEYGLQKDDTYRFIRINDKYSVNGNSIELADRFKGMAQTKLSEMLNLPDSDIDLVTPETTREDIRELKRFNNQSQEDIPEKQGSDIQNIIMEFFRPAAGRPAGALHELLMEVLEIVEGKLQDSVLTQEELIQEKINPKGNGTFRTGRYMLFLYDASHGLKYKVFGENENHQLSYLSFAKTVHLIFTSRNQGGSLDPWENIYGIVSEPEPEKAETREPVHNEKQPGPGTKTDVDRKGLGKKEEDKQECYPQKSQDNSEKAPAQLEEGNDPETDAGSDEIKKHEEEETLETDTEENDQDNGEWQQDPIEDSQKDQKEEESDIKQMEIEEYPEYLPEGYIKCHDGSVVQETETYKKWKEIQSFINDLHTQISNREEPDLETSRKLNSGINYLKMIMDDFVIMKEELEDE
ncbi:hypothetical protein SAMN05443270_3753 [Lacrimispora sphenoides]|uniref:hypothetical protein n=1 Tax=Lacrimispora sphenoides TaxID=29370 RepID=UPI0008AC9BE9|nr:hypothetical protein [Lacrimispora sphenoides]SEU24184.1 hypothetical protein SAMN05443270_3753 [Lacrimispora sphenoides]